MSTAPVDDLKRNCAVCPELLLSVTYLRSVSSAGPLLHRILLVWFFCEAALNVATGWIRENVGAFVWLSCWGIVHNYVPGAVSQPARQEKGLPLYFAVKQ